MSKGVRIWSLALLLQLGASSSGLAGQQFIGTSAVILVRHGTASGYDDYVGLDLQNCATQRNLTEKGRKEARELGNELRRTGITVARVLTSRWCRAQETASLLELGPVSTVRAFDNLRFNGRRADELLEKERRLISSWHGPGILLVVTHISNIKALTGFSIEEGTMIVATPPADRKLGQLRFDKMMLSEASFTP